MTYYVEQVAGDRHGYYAGHGEAPGMWRGAFADHLGLSGDVAAEDFGAVLDGVDPATGESLKSQPNRRVAAWGCHVLTAEVDLGAVGTGVC